MKSIFKHGLYVILATTFLFAACEEDEMPPDIPGADQPPTAPVLLLPLNDTTGIDYRGLNLSWEPGVDPEGGPVAHNVYLDTDEIGIYLGEHTSATDIDLDFSLYPYKEYHWFVGAKDSAGNQTSSEVFYFKTRELIYTTHTMQDQMGDFYDNAMAVFNRKLWSVGGCNGYFSLFVPIDDVWSSDNGVNWISHQSAPFASRGLSLTVFEGKLWAIAGEDNLPGISNDVWYTIDGENWIDATPTDAFGGIYYGHSTVVFNNKMYVIGPMEGVTSDTQVWSTVNGFDWILETDNAFPALSYSSVTVFDGAMYAIGGEHNSVSQNKIYKSTDGVTWQELSPISTFTPRFDHTAITYDGKIWLLGGKTTDAGGVVTVYNEIWYSDDPDQFWYLYDGPDLFSPREKFWSMVYQDEIWIFGGLTGHNPLGGISSFH